MLTLYGKKTCFYKSILHGAQRSRQKYLTHSQPLVHTHMHTQPHTHTHTHPLEKISHPYNFLRLYSIIAATAAKSLQSCPTLRDPMTAAQQAPPSLGFSRQEHWSGLPFPSPMHESEKWKWKVKVKSLSPVWLLATSWTAAYQAPPSMGFSRQEYWSGMPLSSPNRSK